MLVPDGYRFAGLLRASATTQVWSATREADRRRVVAKVFAIEDRPGLEALVQHEFDLIRRLELSGVVRTLALERNGRELVLVLDAHPGVDLAVYARGRTLDIDEFLRIAARLAAILADVHDQRVIHRDIKPTNILIDPATGEVALADFGISVLLDSERARIHDRGVIEGTLPYMAPEQTGRTGREVDFRSDLYSLGATFYELLTGRRPFEAGSPLELIHAHLARRPEPPQRLRPELPTALSDMIMKLLEKAPERRYQSARGLAFDLEQLLAARRGAGTTEFELGRADVPRQLRLPHQLYGREREQAELLAAFRRTVAGTPSFVLIRGDAGVGKSALLDQLVEPVLRARAFLARGKFEAGSEQPYSAVCMALSGLADQLLTETPELLSCWRDRLLGALGGLAPVICALVPRFVHVLGEQVEQRPLAAAEARNQVRTALGRLLTCLARAEHPLVLALDDLQWADANSLELIEGLFGEPNAAILVATTARLKIVRAKGPITNALPELLARLAASGHEPLEFELGPLDRPALTQLIADVLSRKPDEVTTLTEIVARKTGSNPFFARAFLLHLAELDLLTLGPAGWRWDPVELEAASLPDDVLEMMTAKLARLPAEAGELLMVASVVGSEFDPLVVERIGVGSWAGRSIHQLVDEGLIAPVAGRGYVFGHDRIREAAYRMLGDQRSRELHLRVGEDLLARLRADELEQRIFEVVDHLDRGHALGDGRDANWVEIDRVRLREIATLNLRAGRRALASGAPASAVSYLELGARLLEQLGEPPDEPLAFEAELGLAEAQALNGAHAKADARLLALLARDLGAHERGRAAVARIWALILAGRRAESVRFGCEILRSLGIAVPERVGKFDIAKLLPKMVRMARPEALERLCARAPITERDRLSALAVLDALANTTYVTDPMMFVLLSARHAELLERHGDHPSAPQVFAQIGLVVANVLGRRSEAVALARACLELELRRRPGPERYRVQMTAQFVSLWSEPWHALLDPIREVIDLAEEQGDIESSDYAWATYVELSFYGGVHLRVLQERIAARLLWAQRWGTEDFAGGGRVFSRACQLLLDGPPPELGVDDPLDLQNVAQGGLRELNVLGQRMLSAVVLGVFGRWRATLAVVEEIGPVIEELLPGMWYSAMLRVFTGISAAVIASDATVDAGERRRLRRLLEHQRELAVRWTGKGGNFGHVATLLDAECARLHGQLDEAAQLYVRARELTAAQRNPMLEALVCERTATLLIDRGLSRLALGPLLDARERWCQWGAFAKVAQLDEQWPELATIARVVRSHDERTHESTTTTTSESTTSRALDTATLVGISQAIAEDIELADVVERVMALAVENAGAERGVLLLVERGELHLTAEWTSGEYRSQLDATPSLAELSDRLPSTVLRWVERTAEPVVLDEVSNDLRFSSDPYLRRLGGGSVLCTPIVKHGRLIGLLYLENRLSGGCFTAQRLEILRLLAAQAASALENARLYGDLRASEVRWRSLVEQLPDHVVLIDPDGTVEFANRRTQPLDGDGGRTSSLEMLLPESRREVAQALGEAFATGVQQTLEVEWRSRTGEHHIGAVRMAPIVLDGGPARVLVVTTDISERKHLEARVRQQQRLESMGTLAAGVAHEINNPVQGIMNYAELIASSEGVSELVREFASEIEHETDRVATIVRNLLRFSRQEQHEPMEQVSLSSVVDGTISLLRALLRRSQIHLALQIPGDLPPLTCRAQQIQQVVMNLVTNARDALDQRYPGHDEDKRVAIEGDAFERNGRKWLRLRVSDRGGGIPEAVAGRIFDPFFTTKGRDRGTGLGLAVSHGIVRDHGGDLVLHNQPGVGASFAIELPCSPV
jgi:PAS domain S-box-containing protein